MGCNNSIHLYVGYYVWNKEVLILSVNFSKDSFHDYLNPLRDKKEKEYTLLT